MNLMVSGIGFLVLVVGVVLSAVGLPILGAPLLIAGTFCFTALFRTRVILDYCTKEEDKYVMTIRLRFYIMPLMFLGIFRFHYKTVYYRIAADSMDISNVNIDDCAIPAQQYKLLVQQQRRQYMDGTADKDAVLAVCEQAVAQFSNAKRKYIGCIVGMCFAATMLSLGELMPIIATVVSEALLLWLLILWKADYEGAKIKKAAYEHYSAQ